MPARLVALDEGSDIDLNHAMVVVGRHPQCDARLDSLRVSRHHCCMSRDQGEVMVRDLGSTNGIRINGQRVEFGRLRPGDELSIAHIRFRLDDGVGHDATIQDTGPPPDHARGRDPALRAAATGLALGGVGFGPAFDGLAPPLAHAHATPGEHRLAAAVRELLPSGLADRCRIQVIVQVPGEDDAPEGLEQASPAPTPAEESDACRPDSSP